MEVCADGGVVVQKLTGRITEDGGAALIVDYGHDGTKTDTFRVSLITIQAETQQWKLLEVHATF